MKLCKAELGHNSILENGFETTLRLNRCSEPFENGNFQFFANFRLIKLKLLNAKGGQGIQKSLNLKLAMVSNSGNGFEATLR